MQTEREELLDRTSRWWRLDKLVNLPVYFWSSISTEIVNTCILLFMVIERSSISPAYGAVALTNAMQLTSRFRISVQYATNIQRNMESIRRLLQYVDIAPEEINFDDNHNSNSPSPKTKNKTNKTRKSGYMNNSNNKALSVITEEKSTPSPPQSPNTAAKKSLLQRSIQDIESFPESRLLDGVTPKGTLEFRGVHVKYAPNKPDVLKGISITIPAGAKIGVMGRTGSGKSSLALSVVRLAIISAGDIHLGGINIVDMRLSDLRRRVVRLTQNPVVMPGTVRWNLDMEGAFTDTQILDALDKVFMLRYIVKLPLQLNTYISEDTFSSGQKQLFCLARILLNKPDVVLVDEITASVDLQTEERIYKILQSHVDGITVLLITHRPSAIKGCSRVLTLHEGHVVEYDTPQHLLDNKNGFLTAFLNNSLDTTDEKQQNEDKGRSKNAMANMHLLLKYSRIQRHSSHSLI